MSDGAEASRPEPPGRGRPSAIDPARIARIAIGLFEERGYEAVSMTDIADAAGIGRRSLFRYFPGKADLIWDGFAPVQDAQHALFSTGEGVGREAAYETLLASGFAGMAALPDLDMTRTRLTILASHPELIAYGSGRMHASSLAAAAYLHANGYDRLEARVLADAHTTAVLNGYVHWATETFEPRPEDSVRRALDALALMRRG